MSKKRKVKKEKLDHQPPPTTPNFLVFFSVGYYSLSFSLYFVAFIVADGHKGSVLDYYTIINNREDNELK